ncbi:MAG: hypothetical protein U0872_01160 [Planctomycetaceae bacterium]
MALAAAAGCGGMKVVPVEGVVTWNGMPVDKAEVCFIRDDKTKKGEPAAPAIARTDENGVFTLKTGDQIGALPGHYRVTVQKSNLEDLDIPNPLPAPYRQRDIIAYMVANNLVVEHLLPTKYSDMRNSPLEVDVTADGSNTQIELMLEGEPPKLQGKKTAKTSR